MNHTIDPVYDKKSPSWELPTADLYLNRFRELFLVGTDSTPNPPSAKTQQLRLMVLS